MNETVNWTQKTSSKIVEIDSHSINFGPQHPSAHGVLRLILELDGEVVERADPAYRAAASRHREADGIPHLHAGRAVFRPAGLRLADGAGACVLPGGGKAAGHRARRTAAQWIRVLFAEITRVLNHLLNLTTYALDVGAITPSLWGFEEREKLMEFHEAASGARLHANYFRPGGVSKDLPAGLTDRIAAWAETFPKFIDDLEELLTAQPHLETAHGRYRRHLVGGGAGLGVQRAAAARLRRAVGPAPVAAVRQVCRGGVPDSGRHATATVTTATWCGCTRCGRA